MVRISLFADAPTAIFKNVDNNKCCRLSTHYHCKTRPKRAIARSNND